MSEADDLIKSMSELQKVIVLLLDSNNKKPISAKTSFKKELRFQKELFFIAKNIPEIEKEASFDFDFYGPYSENAKAESEALALDDVIDDKEISMELSSLGNEIADRLRKKYSKNVIELIAEFKELLNDMTDDEIFIFVYLTFPQYRRESVIWNERKKYRMSVAISLYKKNKISLECASEIAGISLEKFLKMVD